MKFRPPIWLVCLLLCAALTAGCSLSKGKEPASVAAATLTDQVDEKTKAPLRSLTSFPSGSKVIFISALIKNPQTGTKVEAQWFYDKERKGNFLPVDTATVTFDAASRDKYVAYSLQAAETFPDGTYKVQIWLDGKMAKEITFTIG